MSKSNQLSILSLIPEDSMNIIKTFLIEGRKPAPITLRFSTRKLKHKIVRNNSKDCYVITEEISNGQLKRMEDNEEKKRFIEVNTRRINKYYPVYIDTADELIDYFNLIFCPDDDDDYEDYEDIIIKMTAIQRCICQSNFTSIFTKFINLMGGVYIKST